MIKHLFGKMLIINYLINKMSFIPRTKPETLFQNTLKPYDNPTWDSLDTFMWDYMTYTWNFFNGFPTFRVRIKPNT